jgi:hypothetical protein
MSLLTWNSCPVLLMAAWAIVESLPLLHRPWCQAPGWKIMAWFFRPLALWGLYNSVVRYFESYGFNDRTTFPFAFAPWHDNELWGVTFRNLAQSQDFWMWSTAVFLLGALFIMVCRWFISTPMTRTRISLALGWLVLLNIAMPLAYNCLPDGAADPLENKGSFLNAWFDSGNTMLYCMPHIPNKSQYLKHFGEIQPSLRASIHGVTHPPGASLALYWLGKPFGATQAIGRDRLRYMLGTTVFAALAVLAVFFLGRVVTGSPVIGLMGAALWAVKPATLAYNTFAPDTVYTVFNILCLAFIWLVATVPKRPWGAMAGLGTTLYVLTMLNFNWILFGGIFGLFLTLQAWHERWTIQEWCIRWMVPAGLMGAALLWTCVSYHMNYWTIFRTSLDYTRGFYQMANAYQWIIAMIGGPLDLFLLSGSVVAFLFWRRFPVEAKRAIHSPLVIYLLSLLAVYLVTALSVNILKMESSRVWAWVTALPLVFVAQVLHRSTHPRFYFLMAIARAMLQYYAMQLFLTPCG